MSEPRRPDDVPSECPQCEAPGVFWTMTDVLCLVCHWHAKRETSGGPA